MRKIGEIVFNVCEGENDMVLGWIELGRIHSCGCSPHILLLMLCDPGRSSHSVKLLHLKQILKYCSIPSVMNTIKYGLRILYSVMDYLGLTSKRTFLDHLQNLE